MTGSQTEPKSAARCDNHKSTNHIVWGIADASWGVQRCWKDMFMSSWQNAARGTRPSWSLQEQLPSQLSLAPILCYHVAAPDIDQQAACCS